MTTTPGPGRLAGIDFGTVRIGIAVTDPGGRLSSPLEVYRRSDSDEDTAYFRALVQRESITRFIVGLPVHMSGDESDKSQQARQFGAWLERETGVPVEFFDERYTTVAADELLRNSHLSPKRRAERRDMVAAQQMLAAYLESADRTPRSLE